MFEIESCPEIEQRYIINPHLGLYLPREYQEFHQAEIGSGEAKGVISTFKNQVNGLFLNDTSGTWNQIEGLFSTIDYLQQIKLRVRKIFDPRAHSLRAEFTLKKKMNHRDFKIYQEFNIPIDSELASKIIADIAPEHIINHETSEYGVRKFRYHIAGPDGKLWDVDVLQGLNAGLHIGEIEVDSTETVIVLPTWAVMRVNGKPDFRFLGTKELQKIPWAKLSDKKKTKYRQVLGINTSEKEVVAA